MIIFSIYFIELDYFHLVMNRNIDIPNIYFPKGTLNFPVFYFQLAFSITPDYLVIQMLKQRTTGYKKIVSSKKF